jgi:1-deoxy-D-xylulose-5-phosphate synthase
VTFSAGMAKDGLLPFCNIYSSFAQRAYDQILHDVAIQNLPVTFAIDRGGVVGSDGSTHHGIFDISYLRAIPNMTVMTPSDENECRLLLSTAFRMKSPAAVRYPRGRGPGVPVEKTLETVPVRRSCTLRQSGAQQKRVAILAFGYMAWRLKSVAEQLDATLIDMRFVKPPKISATPKQQYILKLDDSFGCPIYVYKLTRNKIRFYSFATDNCKRFPSEKAAVKWFNEHISGRFDNRFSNPVAIPAPAKIAI